LLHGADASLRPGAADDAAAAPLPVAGAEPSPAAVESATFVVVPAPSFGEAGDAARSGPASAALLTAAARDAALREAFAGGVPILVGVASLAAASAAWRGFGSAASVIFVLLLLGLHAAWAGTVVAALRRPKRHAQGLAAWRRFSALAFVCIALLAVAPWALPVEAGSDGGSVFMALAITVALTGAIAVATLPPVAAAAVLLPLSAGLASASAASAATGAIVVPIAALLAASRHRAWRRMQRRQADLEETIMQLRSERDGAMRADEEKSRFLAIASHDLRQPVHALGLFAATLEKRLLGSPEEPLARNMIRSIEGLDRSFNAMLDISRLDAGTIEPNVQQFPLRDLFRRLHMHFAGQAEMSGLALRFSPGGKSVSSDPQLLERILGNLVQNAIKYTEEGGVVVVARTTETHVNIEVWDTGVGIRAADLPRVFDEFYQVGRSERARAQGLGIGLAIVKRLAMLLGHQLTVSSRPGRGTMFRIGIRIGGLYDMQDVTAPADTLPMPLPQARTVLVIDDEEAIREGLALLLEEWGYHAVIAGSITQAQRVVASLDGPPDLILSDLHLGDGPDGIAAIQAVRTWCGHDVSAVLITGDTSHEEMRRATDSGHPVLFKPVQPRRLYNVLRGLVS